MDHFIQKTSIYENQGCIFFLYYGSDLHITYPHKYTKLNCRVLE